LQGHRLALQEAGLPWSPELVAESQEASVEIGMRMTERLLALPTGRPDALIANNHLLLIGLLRAVRGSGLRVPDEMGVVGFDEYPWTPLMDPPLTVVHQPRPQIGEAAARRLIQRVRGEVKGPGETLLIEPTLIVRSSCGVLRRAARDGAELRRSPVSPGNEPPGMARDALPGYMTA
jgi:DNA-binding LacI/PurR family transcriptional regulator